MIYSQVGKQNLFVNEMYSCFIIHVCVYIGNMYEPKDV